MKPIIFVYLLTLSLISADEDPFIDVYDGMGPVVTARWEKLLVDDRQFDGKLIFIDGFISVEKYGSEGFRYYLYLDSESLKYSRAQRSIFIDSNSLDSILSKKHSLSSSDKLALNGRYAKVLGIYKKPKSDNLAMCITGPLTIHFREGSVGPVTVLKD